MFLFSILTLLSTDAPVFKEGTDNKEVNLGENVTIDCSAEGNPVPKILLNYSSAVNVKETIRGRQKGISITGATSTNAGVYSCDAINEVGRVTRYVTLTMKGIIIDYVQNIYGNVYSEVVTDADVVLYIGCRKEKKHLWNQEVTSKLSIIVVISCLTYR